MTNADGARGLVALQLGAVWALGGLLLPAVVQGLAPLLFIGWGAVLAGALGGVAAVVTCLWLVITPTGSVSVLGGTAPRRACWALLVFGGGAALWRLGWAVTDEAQLGVSNHQVLTVVLGGVPFVLMAGMLLRPRPLRLGAAAALVGVAALGLLALKHLGPDELPMRLQSAGLDRSTAYAVEIPGYRPVDDAYGGRLGTGDFLPADPNAVPPPRYVTIVAYGPSAWRDGQCQVPVDSHLSTADCTLESGGLAYVHGVVEHGYRVRRGAASVVVAGSLAVDRQLLRQAALTVRPATAAERATAAAPERMFVADVPGYRGQPMGIPPGMSYEPADHSSGPQSVLISLHAVRAASDTICFQVICQPEGDGLTYVRGDATQGYVLRRGEVNVRVTGGVSVDRALLRQVALAARPATDAELLRALPPAPADGPLDRLRTWLREHT
ncbi:hypothetical protein [Micromonospora sp. NPDC007230]|uniref:hypothetical protein n=1 Tax=Micromonospora sp. NPDC007230 TaxID=3364237 RepID=UPI00368D7F63